ncbi:MAG: GNAT family N-acetyltransferase [Cyclobacteriaceae bacterium]
MAITIRPISANLVPLDLLLIADPSEQQIALYLPHAECFVAEDERVLAVCVVKSIDPYSAEIVNIAVYPDQQGTGVGTKLLRFLIDQLRGRGVKQLVLGTGTFGYQLTFYQRLGFRVIEVERNYFLKHYDQPIYESGIQHKDRLMLELDLSET